MSEKYTTFAADKGFLFQGNNTYLMREGDKIRFLDAVGGGTIVQYDAQRELVWVETDEGCDVGPIPAAKCVMDTAATIYQRKGCIGTD